MTRQAAANRPVWLSILGLSWFWAIGATLLSEFPSVARDALGADGHVVTLLLTMFAVGVGIGSMLCARLLHGEVSARYVPFAAFGITLFTWDFGSAVIGAGGLHLTTVAAVLGSPTGWRMLADLLLLAVCGGLYSVPLYAIVQERSEPSHRARMIAANNIVNAVMMVRVRASSPGSPRPACRRRSVLQIAARGELRGRGVDRPPVAAKLFPRRCSSGISACSTPRVSRVWRTLPPAGERAILVINHLSFLDGCLVAAFVPGDLVFAIDTEQARRFWFLKYVIDVFPVDPNATRWRSERW